MAFLSLSHTIRSWLAARPWRGLGGLGLLRLVAWGILLGALETLGRASANEWVDALGVLGITSLVTIVVGRTSEVRRLTWKVRARHAVGRLVAPWKLRTGLDLRGTPPLEAQQPWRYAVLIGAILVGVAALLATHSLWPGAARDVLRSVSGLLYLGALTLLWGFLGLATCTLWIASFAALDELVGRYPRWRQHRGTLFGAAGVLVFLGVAAGALFVPLVVPLAIVGATLVLYGLVVVPTGWSLQTVWKYPGRGAGPYASRWVFWDVPLVTGLAGLLALPALLAAGERLLGPGAPHTAISGFLGGAFAWTLALFAPGCLGFIASRLLVAWIHSPARPAKVRVVVGGALDPARVAQVKIRLESAGFVPLLDPARRRPTDVSIVLDEATTPRDFRLQFRWPRHVSFAMLESLEVHEALYRRAHTQCRRILLRRLKKLLKHARRRKYERGGGFWIAPHLWFATHLTRDTDEEDQVTIGPPYRKLIPRPALHHLHRVLRGVDLDLVFLEDGVRFDGFRRVMAAVFEHFDVFGDKRIEDHRHFAGIPGVRVMIHEFVLEEPFRSDKYPEPDYEDLGRARVLHVFRDRGGDDSDVTIPDDLSSLPEPVGSFGGPMGFTLLR